MENASSITFGEPWTNKISYLSGVCDFLESKFCFSEYGAAWVKSVDQMILLVPSLTPSHMTGIFLGIQAGAVTDKIALNELKEKIAVALGTRSLLDDRREKRGTGQTSRIMPRIAAEPCIDIRPVPILLHGTH